MRWRTPMTFSPEAGRRWSIWLPTSKHFSNDWKAQLCAKVITLSQLGRAVPSRNEHLGWMQGMMCGHTSGDDCIKAFSETDVTEDLKKFDVPSLIVDGDDDQ